MIPSPGNPFSSGGMSAGSAFASGSRVARGLDRSLEDVDNSLIGNVSRFMSRPLYAVTALLDGDPVDALENLVQLGLDLPTLGGLNRNWSLGNLFSETGDITDRSERREASDLFGYQGDGMGKLGVDVLGGMLLDPLTYLTFGGSGIAKGALTGMPKVAAASRVSRGLKATKIGTGLLKSATDDLLRSSSRLSKAVSKAGGLDNLAGASDDVLRELFPEVLGKGARAKKAAATARQIETSAVEWIVRQVNPAAELGVNTGGIEAIRAAGSTLDEVVESLIGKGALYADDALRIQGPFGLALPGINPQTPRVRNVWSKIGEATPIGLSKRIGGALMGDSGAWVDELQKSTWRYLKGTFHDKIGAGEVVSGLEHFARKIDVEQVGDMKRRMLKVLEIFPHEKFTDDTMRHVGDVLKEVEDEAAEYLEAARELAKRNPEVRHTFDLPSTPGALEEIPFAGVKGYPVRDLGDIPYYRGERFSIDDMAELGKAPNLLRPTPYELLGEITDAKTAQASLAEARALMEDLFGPDVFSGDFRQSRRAVNSVLRRGGEGMAKVLDRTKWKVNRGKLQPNRIAFLSQGIDQAQKLMAADPDEFFKRWAAQAKEVERFRGYGASDDALLWATTSRDVAERYGTQWTGGVPRGIAEKFAPKGSTPSGAIFEIKAKLNAGLDLSKHSQGVMSKRQVRDLIHAVGGTDELLGRLVKAQKGSIGQHLIPGQMSVESLFRGDAGTEFVKLIKDAGYDSILHQPFNTNKLDIAILDRGKLRGISEIAGERVGRSISLGQGSLQPNLRANGPLQPAGLAGLTPPRAAPFAGDAMRTSSNLDELRRLPREQEELLLRGARELLDQRLGAEKGAEAHDALMRYLGEMEKIPEDLVKLGVWDQGWGRAFYMPHRMDAQLSDLLSDPGVIRELRTHGVNLSDVFTKARKNPTSKGYMEAVLLRLSKVGEGDLASIMEQLDLIQKKVNKETGEWIWEVTGRIPDTVAGDVMETNLRELFLRRELAHSQTLKRHRLWNVGEQFGMVTKKLTELDGGDPKAKQYILGLLDNGKAPTNKLYKLVAGGSFEIPATEGMTEIPKFLELFGEGRFVGAGANRRIKFTTRGINYPIKSLLTSFPTNVSFPVRNWLGAQLMASFDPDLGYKTLRSTIESFPHLAWLEKATPWMSQSNLRKFMRVVEGHDVLDVLDELPGSVGKWTWREAMEHVQNAVGDVTEVRSHLRDMDDAARALAGEGAEKGWFARAVGFGEAASNYTEKGARTAAMLELLEKGVDPIDAAKRVGDAFVNYRSQSETEKFARAIIPFFKFQSASAVWLGEFARRPRLITPLARVRGSSESALGPGEALPETVRDGTGIRVGSDADGNPQYVQSLGLPQEAALQGLGMFSSFEGMRKGLGMAHPIGKFFAEGATNRDFYTGEEFASYTKAPTILRPFAKTRKSKSGKDLYEIPGFWREVFDTLPTSRISTTVDRFFQENRDTWDSALQSTTGLRIRTVDEERELRRALEDYLKAKSKSGTVGEFTTWFAKGDPNDVPEDLKVVLDRLRRMRRGRKERE